MVYQRVRNSRYAQYSRALGHNGRQANFSMPIQGRVSNFSLASYVPDLINQGGDMFHSGVNAARQFAENQGSWQVPRMPNMAEHAQGMMHGARGAFDSVSNGFGGMANGARQFFDNAGDALGGAAQRLGNSVQGMSTSQQLGAGAGVGAGAVGAAGLGRAAYNGMRKGAQAVAETAPELGQAVEQVAETVSNPGFRESAARKLRNPMVLGAGAAGLGAAGLGTAAYLNREQE